MFSFRWDLTSAQIYTYGDVGNQKFEFFCIKFQYFFYSHPQNAGDLIIWFWTIGMKMYPHIFFGINLRTHVSQDGTLLQAQTLKL